MLERTVVIEQIEKKKLFTHISRLLARQLVLRRRRLVVGIVRRVLEYLLLDIVLDLHEWQQLRRVERVVHEAQQILGPPAALRHGTYRKCTSISTQQESANNSDNAQTHIAKREDIVTRVAHSLCGIVLQQVWEFVRLRRAVAAHEEAAVATGDEQD